MKSESIYERSQVQKQKCTFCRVTPRPRNMYPDTCLDFLTVFFSGIYFYFVIIYIIIWHRIWIFGLKVCHISNPGPDLSVLLDLAFLLVKFDQFQFQILFSIF